MSCGNIFIFLQARIANDLRELISIENENVNNYYYGEIRITMTQELLENIKKSSIEYCLDEIQSILNSSDDGMGYKQQLLSRSVSSSLFFRFL